MGQRFRDSGYRTAYIGKWHLDAHDYFGTGVCPDGWDDRYWYDGRRYLDELTDDQITLWRQGLDSPDALAATTSSLSSPGRTESPTGRSTSCAARTPISHSCWLCSYDEPHHPYTCPPEYAARFADYRYQVGPGAFDDLSGKPSHQREWSATCGRPLVDGCLTHPLYFGCNSFVDSEIGRVIDATHASAASDDTYLIYTSDHGDMMGAHGIVGKGPVGYEEITHIPLLVEQPGGASAGTVNETLVSHVDLLPTMLDLAGLETPPILEGESMAAQLAGIENDEKGVVIEFNRYEIEHDSWGGYQPLRCIVSGHHKLVINLLHEDELYDLARDPGEVRNLIDDPDYAATRDWLHDRLLDWMNDKRDPHRGPVWERRPWRQSRRLQWRGQFRPRPADGYSPVVRDYDTGLPTQGVKVERTEKPR